MSETNKIENENNSMISSQLINISYFLSIKKIYPGPRASKIGDIILCHCPLRNNKNGLATQYLNVQRINTSNTYSVLRSISAKRCALARRCSQSKADQPKQKQDALELKQVLAMYYICFRLHSSNQSQICTADNFSLLQDFVFSTNFQTQ